jgi:GT2 family glycosyltransferase
MKKDNLISIIIANFNGEQFINNCLNSVLKSSYKNIELIIIDDGSTDKSTKLISKYLKDSRVLSIKNESNLGAAASRNKAINVSNGKIIIFLDNDTKVQKDWIDQLIKPIISDNSIGAAQSLIFDYSKENLVQNAGGKLIPHTGWLIPDNQWIKKTKINFQTKYPLIVAISAALAVRRDVIKRINGFDEKEGVYTEDLDLSWRIWLLGYKVVLAPDSVVYHWTKPLKMRSSMNATFEKIYFHLAKNSLRSIIKNYEFSNALRYSIYSILINLIRAILVLIRRHDPSALVGTLRAYIWNVLNFADTLSQRAIVQSRRKTSDHQLSSLIFDQDSLFKIYKKYFYITKLI